MNGVQGPSEKFSNLMRFEWWRRTAQTAEPGVEGDLWVRGPSIAAGYWNRSADPLTADKSTIGIGSIQAIEFQSTATDGLRYRCRADDIEIVGGLNVNPVEVERLIVDHDNVAEAAVVSVTEPAGATALQAFVVPASGKLVEQSIIRDIHRRLLTQFVGLQGAARFAVVERLPRTSTGKLLRGALRAESPTEPIWDLAAMAPQSDPEDVDGWRAGTEFSGC